MAKENVFVGESGIPDSPAVSVCGLLGPHEIFLGREKYASAHSIQTISLDEDE